MLFILISWNHPKDGMSNHYIYPELQHFYITLKETQKKKEKHSQNNDNGAVAIANTVVILVIIVVRHND